VPKIRPQVGKGHRGDLGNFRRVGCECCRGWAKVDIDEFVFDQAVGQLRAVAGMKSAGEGGGGAQFFVEPPVGGGQGEFAGPGVAAASVGPQTTGMIFRETASLQQELSAGIDEENGKRAMELPVNVHGLLLAAPLGAILGVHENDFFGRRGHFVALIFEHGDVCLPSSGFVNFSFLVPPAVPKSNSKKNLLPPSSASAVRVLVDHGFIPVRAKLIEVAAFLDRVERHAVADDFRCAALRQAAAVLVDGRPERARRILEQLSDPTSQPEAISSGKAALGAWLRPVLVKTRKK